MRGWTWVLMLAVLGYLVWQYRVYYTGQYPYEKSTSGKVLYRVQKATGIHDPATFTYAAYYWGLLPVFSTYVQSHARDAAIYSEEAARNILVERGESLRMDSLAVRWGARMNTLLQYPVAVVKGSPQGADHRVTSAFIYVCGLLLLTVALWWHAAPPLFVVLPMLLASSSSWLTTSTGRAKCCMWASPAWSTPLRY